MADKIAKILAKLPSRQRVIMQLVIARLIEGDVSGLDIKSLKGSSGMHRVRVGEYRIIYAKGADGEVRIHSIAKRDERTYRGL